MLHAFAAGIGGVSRLVGPSCSLLEVAESERGKPLQKQRERHDPCVTVLAAQRQRFGSPRNGLDVTPLEVMHVSQPD